MPRLEIKETFVNATEGIRFGDTEWEEPWTNEIGKLFRDMQREYGRCTGRIYQDRTDADGHWDTYPLGWVFEKRMLYEGSRRTEPRWNRTSKSYDYIYPSSAYYTREVWVMMRQVVTEEEGADAL